MDSIFEIIIPVVVALFYFINAVFKKSRDGEEPSPSDEQFPGEKSRELGPPGLQGAIGREAQKTSGKEPDEDLKSSSESGSRKVQTAKLKLMKQAGAPTVGRSTSSKLNPLEGGDLEDSYEAAMQAKLKQIEVTRLQAEAIRQEVSKPAAAGAVSSAVPTLRKVRFSGSVRATLSNPQTARSAFLYGEVFGMPVSQKKSSSVPGLN